MFRKLYVVGNKVEIPEYTFISKHNCEDVLLFVGKMNYEPNVVAVTSFAERVFPKLLDSHPNLQFFIVGAHPDTRVRNLADKSNIIVTGFVDSLQPYFQRATVVVAPMLTGAGIQNKIIQAMSYACCVVTTSVGAEGLNIRKHEIEICDSAEDMANVVHVLLCNRNLRVQMGMAARQYVIDNLSDEIVAKQFWNFIDL